MSAPRAGPTPALPSDLPRLPRRGRDSHKGSFGTVAIVGGSAHVPSIGGGGEGGTGGEVMIGAPALAALAALRAGCGLCRLAMPASILPHAMTVCPSATGLAIAADRNGCIEPHAASSAVSRLAADAACLAVGPGMGTSPGAQATVLRAVHQTDTPIVLDADGLNCLGLIPPSEREIAAAAVLTPHPGEFRRLTAALGFEDGLYLDIRRETAASELAGALGVVVVLKGAGTVVSDGDRVWTNTVDHPCLATAGTGDVLTGIIASVIAQFVGPDEADPLDLFDAARVGVAVHGLCGALWARSRGAEGGLLAAELTEFIPGVIESLRA